MTDDDLPVLFRIYADSRTEEMAQWGWDDTQVEQFLHQQFETQVQAYLHMFPEASFELALLDGEPVERNNPILPWYRRIGFQETDENGPYLHMKRRASEATAQTQEGEDV